VRWTFGGGAFLCITFFCCGLVVGGDLAVVAVMVGFWVCVVMKTVKERAGGGCKMPGPGSAAAACAQHAAGRRIISHHYLVCTTGHLHHISSGIQLWTQVQVCFASDCSHVAQGLMARQQRHFWGGEAPHRGVECKQFPSGRERAVPQGRSGCP
jgi:hypothetical protein